MGNGGERREISFALHTITRLIPLRVFFLIFPFSLSGLTLLLSCLCQHPTYTPPQPLFPRHENTAHTLLDVKAFSHCVLFASACSFVPTSLIPRTKVFLRLCMVTLLVLLCELGLVAGGKGKRLSGL